MPKEAYGVSYSDLAKAGFVSEHLETGYEYGFINTLSDLKRFLRFAEAHGEYRERSANLESDSTFGQLIMYGFHLRPDGKFFLYQRGGAGSYDEARLAGQVSVGIGGHMERTDLSLARSFKRELGEEVHANDNGSIKNFLTPEGAADIQAIRNTFRIQPRGILRDVRRPVDSVHVGLVARLIPRDPSLNLLIVENCENIASQYVSITEYQSLVSSGQVVPEMWTDAVIREEIVPLLAQK